MAGHQDGGAGLETTAPHLGVVSVAAFELVADGGDFEMMLRGAGDVADEAGPDELGGGVGHAVNRLAVAGGTGGRCCIHLALKR